MKKFAVFALTFLVLLLGISYAAESIANTAVTVVGATATTNTVQVRGLVDYIKVTCPSGGTADVSVVTTDGITLLSKSGCTGTGSYVVRVPTHTTAGVATTNSVGDAVRDRIGIADSVVVILTQAIATTNTYGVKITYQQ